MTPLWLLLALLLSLPVQDEAAIHVKNFEGRYRAAKTLQATFLERYLENGVTVRTEATLLRLLKASGQPRPNWMRSSAT